MRWASECGVMQLLQEQNRAKGNPGVRKEQSDRRWNGDMADEKKARVSE